MHQSAFSYGLTKPYPYPWFTWVVVIGGIVATGLFSVLNFAANGYEIVTEFVTDLNGTENPQPPAWYQKKPWSFASKVNIVCQEQVLEIGSQFRMNSTFLKYEVIGIETIDLNRSVSKSSFTYRNGSFHDCRITSFYVKRSSGVITNNVMQHGYFSALQATVNCTVYEYGSHVPTTLSLAYDSLQSSKLDVDPFSGNFVASINNATNSAFWWGAFILYVASYAGALPDESDTFPLIYNASTQGIALAESTRADIPYPIIESDIFANDSLRISFAVMGFSMDKWASSFGDDLLRYYACVNSSNISTSCSTTDSSDSSRLLTLFWDSVAKVFSSFVMTDLGQSTKSNIFASNDGLVSLFAALDKSSWENYFREPHLDTDAINEFFQNYLPNSTDPSTFYRLAGTGEPQVHSASINTQYLCQIPKRKSIGSIILNVIVSDLVFLRALWSIFSWIVKFSLERQEPKANYCVGCAMSMADNQLSRSGTHSIAPSDYELNNVLTSRRQPVGSLPQTTTNSSTDSADDPLAKVSSSCTSPQDSTGDVEAKP